MQKPVSRRCPRMIAEVVRVEGHVGAGAGLDPCRGKKKTSPKI